MKFKLLVIAILLPGLSASSQRPPEATALESFFKLDLPAAMRQAEAVLAREPKNGSALFARMETAELQGQTHIVMDSALRLCATQASPALLEVASGRIFRHAGNTQAFHAVVRRVNAEAQQGTGCAENLQLALMAAAADGDPEVDLDHAASAAGLLTRWRVAGPFGRYSNADFDRKWEPESDQFSHSVYGKLKTEEFRFRDGSILLPDHFPGAGVFYASSDVEISRRQESMVEVFGPGPYCLFVDGELALVHDSRLALKSARDSAAMQLLPGKHRVMIKFTLDAEPLQVAVHPQVQPHRESRAPLAAPLKNYAEGLAAYFREDLPGLQQSIHSSPVPAIQYLRALLYSDAEGYSAEAHAAWEALGAAPLARVRLAQTAMAHGRGDDFRQEIASLASLHPDFEPLQQLAFQLTPEEGPLRRLLALHPSCANLAEALSFYNSSGRQQDSQKIERQVATCAPESLDYARRMAEAGRHAEAASYLAELVKTNPWQRAARRMLVQELLLSGRGQQAQQEAHTLHELSPGSEIFARWEVAPYEALDSRSDRADGFPQENQFYAAYQRDGLRMVRETAARQFSGGPSVILLWDKAVALQADGDVSVYTHRVTRLLNKEGIVRLGELVLPRGADLLELRTIKQSGEMVEPELAQQKPTISMPALEPGDSIEEEYVTHYSAEDAVLDAAAAFTFGSFTAPILHARFVLIAPEGMQVRISQSDRNIPASIEHSQGNAIHVWEQNNIAQAISESDLPPENLLPSVSIGKQENLREKIRDRLIEATRIGLQITEAAQTLRQSAADEQHTARNLYKFVITRIRPSGDWTDAAEETLRNQEGSRTSALLALARASGLKAALVLAHKPGQHCDATLNCYKEPLVRFWLPESRVMDVAPEAEGLPFGAIPPSLDSKDALLVSPASEDERLQFHTALLPALNDEKSVAEAELFLQPDGRLTTELHVRLGATRAQQVRNVLRGSGLRQRQVFFEQLATRIFPGAESVTGTATGENDVEQPIELRMQCKVLQAMRQDGGVDLSRLIPALGLKELYARTPTRKFPLYLDSLFSESAVFHLHLPPGMQAGSLPDGFSAHNEFGDYSMRLASTNGEITIERDFRIPAQVISPPNYQAFADFARQIEAAEQGRIALHSAPTTTARTF